MIGYNQQPTHSWPMHDHEEGLSEPISPEQVEEAIESLARVGPSQVHGPLEQMQYSDGSFFRPHLERETTRDARLSRIRSFKRTLSAGKSVASEMRLSFTSQGSTRCMVFRRHKVQPDEQ